MPTLRSGRTYGTTVVSTTRVPLSRRRTAASAARRQRALIPYRPVRYGGFNMSRMNSGKELKFNDISVVNMEGNTTGSFQLLNGIAQGTDYNQRIGRKICMKGLYIRAQVQPSIDNVADQLVRLVVVLDLQPNGAAPTITDIFSTASSVSFINPNNRDRFRILYDKHCIFGKRSTTATQTFDASPGAHYVRKYLKLRGLETIYNATGSTIGSISSNSLYAVAIGPVGAGSGCTFAVAFRLRYSDA